MDKDSRSQGKRGQVKRPRRKTKHKGLGITTFVYFLIFFYLIFCIVSFLLKKEVNYISAEKGFIYNAQVFDGIILRNETVINSETDGVTSFYVPEGEKINIESLVCTVDANGEFTNEIKNDLSYINNQLAYSNNCNSHESIKRTLYTYSVNYNKNDFKSVYKLKTNIHDSLLNITQSMYINNTFDTDSLIKNKELLESQIAKNVNLVKAFKSGVVSYKIDGYEKFDITSLDFKALFNHETEDIYTFKEERVKKERPLFKIINNDKWYIISEITKELTNYIGDDNYISINIIEKDITANAKIINIVEEDKKKYMILEIDRYFNQYFSNRNIKFEVVYDQYNGIKIPMTSIAEKDFIGIPKECITQKGNTKGILKKTFGKEFVGGESVEFVNLGFYYKDNDSYYVPISEKGFQINDIVMNNTNGNYTLNEKKSLPGVYIINKGYTSFKLIEDIYSTDKYMIVKPDTPYGIRIYDRVISDSKTIEEDVILY